MSDKIQVCNKENGCYSQLWGRDCWVANSVLGLVMAHVDTLHERSEDPATDKVLKEIDAYCRELREKNKQEHWPDELHPDLSAPAQ